MASRDNFFGGAQPCGNMRFIADLCSRISAGVTNLEGAGASAAGDGYGERDFGDEGIRLIRSLIRVVEGRGVSGRRGAHLDLATASAASSVSERVETFLDSRDGVVDFEELGIEKLRLKTRLEEDCIVEAKKWGVVRDSRVTKCVTMPNWRADQSWLFQFPA